MTLKNKNESTKGVIKKLYKTELIEFKDWDRVVYVKYDKKEIVGLNFHQGIGFFDDKVNCRYYKNDPELLYDYKDFIETFNFKEPTSIEDESAWDLLNKFFWFRLEMLERGVARFTNNN
tara:strand:- start:63 stop:419 length:357 start_codon:yes stop_codon:yes gene_type:complete